VHRQPAVAPWARDDISLPATEELARTNLALPMGPALTASEIEAVATSVQRAASALSAP
jgi:dTDP-4-amino-4,6-dideoxygalactose transaminase